MVANVRTQYAKCWESVAALVVVVCLETLCAQVEQQLLEGVIGNNAKPLDCAVVRLMAAYLATKVWFLHFVRLKIEIALIRKVRLSKG